MFSMFKSFRPRRRSAVAFAGFALASFAAAPAAFAQQTEQTADTVRVATEEDLIRIVPPAAVWSMPPAPVAVAAAQTDAEKPAPDPCTLLTVQALRIAQSCNGEVTMPPEDLQSRLPLLAGTPQAGLLRSFDVQPTDGDIALLLAPREYSRPQTVMPGDETNDVVVVTGIRPVDRDIGDAYFADLERRFGNTGFNASYREFEDWLASGTGRTVSALGLGLLRNAAEDAVRDELQDFIIGGADTRGDFSMDPIGDRTDAWMRETFLRQRGINPDHARRPR